MSLCLQDIKPTNNKTGDIMQKRAVLIFGAIFTVFTVLYLQVYMIASNEGYKEQAVGQHTQTEILSSERGDIYDRNGTPMILSEESLYIVINPKERIYVSEILAACEISAQQLYDKLKIEQVFSLKVVNEELLAANYISYRQTDRSDLEYIASNIIGYTDIDGIGVSGIEKSYDLLLSGGGESFVLNYEINGYNQVGSDAEIEVYSVEGRDSSVTLTIDKQIQEIVEEFGGAVIEKGAIVISMVETGEIVASASFPSQNPTDIVGDMQNENLPLINRAFMPYNVGSVFKIVVAAAALDTNTAIESEFICDGDVEIGGVVFRCHEREGHGELDFMEAIAVSCNPYFIELGNRVGYNEIYTLANLLGFNSSVSFATGLNTSSGYLPVPDPDSSDILYSNIYFGQGELLATPVQLNSLMATVANGGYYNPPTLVKSTTENGITTEPDKTASKKVISSGTVALLTDALVSVVEEGSGAKAYTDQFSVAGKTGSAQTGQFVGDSEIVHAWFSGFYPANNPKYAITILVEEGVYGSEVAAPLFTKIAAEIKRLAL